MQRKPANRSTDGLDTDTALRAAGSGGTPLSEDLRSFFEPGFGHDFSQVRVHTDAEAARAADGVHARAYTVGRDIVFGGGQYAPDTPDGRRLLAHELTHVVQQGASDATLQREPDAKPADQPTDMMRIYSFGPRGGGRVATQAGTTMFPPQAATDAQGHELVGAGTKAEPIRSRWGRFFTIDNKEHPYPQPVPPFTVRAHTAWVPGDGSAVVKDLQEDKDTKYYRPEYWLGTTLGDEYVFNNDGPGLLTIVYSFSPPNGMPMMLQHSVRYVSGGTPGSTKAAVTPRAAAAPATADAQAPQNPYGAQGTQGGLA